HCTSRAVPRRSTPSRISKIHCQVCPHHRGHLISQCTVQRYQQGTINTPRTATAEVMDQETAKDWQPQVCAQARARASITGGPAITARARFGFRAGASTSNDSRIRLIRQPVSPS
ncbi:hypothetical protein ACIBM7_39050, partial [Streptomyces atratus]